MSACERADGVGVEEGTFTYNAAISACEKAEEVGVETDTLTYNAAIIACEKADREGIETDTFTYNTAISACEKAHGEGVKAGTFTYDAAISACEKAGVVGTKRYSFVRVRTTDEVPKEWREMSTQARRPWEIEAAKEREEYDCKLHDWRRSGELRNKPKYPRSAYFLWVAHLRRTGRLQRSCPSPSS